MSYIIIHPYSRKLKNGKENPKNYPFWSELLKLINDDIVQVGVEGENQLVDDFRKGLTVRELETLLRGCKTWISIDSFFQHFAWYNKKPGNVIWGVGDPLIFGHKENNNILKDRKYLRANQFGIYEECEFISESFLLPNEIIQKLWLL